MPNVVIFSHQEGREIDGVIDLLRAKGIQIQRFNLCQFPQSLRFSLSKGSGQTSPAGAAGWAHNTGEFSFARELTGMEREVAMEECDAFIEALLTQQSCTWLNAPANIRAAGNKPNQLRRAEELGLPVPDYRITNDPAVVAEFRNMYPQIVMKALRVGFLHYGPGDGWKFYTKSLMPTDCLDGLEYSPQIFQERIRRKAEIRVTVVDGNCYSIGINCENLPEGVTDIRELDYEKERARFFVPEGIREIESWSIRLLQEYGLGYGGLDWAIDHDGRASFFEMNACGSFKWFEKCGAGDITSALADALARRCGSEAHPTFP